MTAHPRVPKKDYSQNIYYSLPDRLQKLVCRCDKPIFAFVKFGLCPPACRNCNGVPLWFAHRCVACREYFIRDFSNPKYCDLWPHCWDCLDLLTWEHCPDHLGPSFHFDPVGLNPKKYSKEELAAFEKELFG